MTFAHSNPATGKTWTRDELHAALLKTEARCQVTADLLAERQQGSRFVTWNDQMINLQARWGRHLEEWAAATADTQQLAAQLRSWFESFREEMAQPLIR